MTATRTAQGLPRLLVLAVVLGGSFAVTAALGVPLAAMLVVPLVLACPVLLWWLLRTRGHT